MEEQIAIYVRVSTDKQKDRYSLPKQEEEGIKYALENNFVPVVFREIASGANTENRPVWLKLQEQLEAGQFKHLWVIDIDRLTRSIKDKEIIKELLKKEKITLHEKNTPIDFSNIDAGLIIDFKSVIAQYERNKIIQRVKRGVEKSKDKGEWKVKSLTGYIIKNGEVLGFDEEKKPIIEYIFKNRLDGMSYRAIAYNLNLMGYRLWNTKTAFYITWVLKTLNNPHYAGLDYDSKGELVESKFFKGYEYVSVEDWKLIQKLKPDPPSRDSKRMTKYFLSGLITCKHCKARYYAQFAKKILVYNHKSINTNVECCQGNPSVITKTIMDDIALHLIRDLITNEEDLRNYAIKNENSLITKTRNINIAIDNNKQSIKNLNEKKKKAINLVLEGFANQEDMKSSLEEINREIANCEENIKKLGREKILILDVKEIVKSLQLENFDTIFSSEEPDLRIFAMKVIKKMYFDNRVFYIESMLGTGYKIEIPFKLSYEIMGKRKAMVHKLKGKTPIEGTRYTVGNPINRMFLIDWIENNKEKYYTNEENEG